MVDKFGTLYVGTVEHDEIGFDAPAVNQRWYDAGRGVGRGYTLDNLTLVPQPRHSTECWQPVVSATDRGLDFMLDHDIKAFVGGGAASGGAGMITLDDAVDAGSWLVGPPEPLIDALGRVQETYPGLEEVMVAQPVGAPATVVLEQMEWFAQEVMPAFGGGR